jgi:hypothetical protein
MLWEVVRLVELGHEVVGEQLQVLGPTTCTCCQYVGFAEIIDISTLINNTYLLRRGPHWESRP